jgi:hypothetical protein
MLVFGCAREMRWDGATDEIRFAVRRDGQPVLCRVSRKALCDQFGQSAHSPTQCLDLAKAYFDILTGEVGGKIRDNRYEHDGSVLLRNSDMFF